MYAAARASRLDETTDAAVGAVVGAAVIAGKVLGGIWDVIKPDDSPPPESDSED